MERHWGERSPEDWGYEPREGDAGPSGPPYYEEGLADQDGWAPIEPPQHPPRYAPPVYGPPRSMPSNKPLLAGTILIVAGAISILIGAVLLAASFNIFGEDPVPDEYVNIHGTVEGVDGQGIPNASIRVIDQNLRTTADSEGRYVITGVRVGHLRISAEKEGYITTVRRITFWEGSTVDTAPVEHQIDFTLNEGEGTQRIGEYDEDPHGPEVGFICSAYMILTAIPTVVGGFFALKRRNFPVVLVGGVFGVLSFGFFISSVLALVALIIAAMCRDEFGAREPERPVWERHW